MRPQESCRKERSQNRPNPESDSADASRHVAFSPLLRRSATSSLPEPTPTADTTDPVPASRSRFRFPLLVAAGAIGIFALLALQQRAMERAAITRASVVEHDTKPATRSLAEVAEAVRTLKLVTVEIKTSVSTQVRDESWRGDSIAHVTAPARLLYGVNLDTLDSSSISLAPLGKLCTIRVPKPERIATEVYTEDESIDVQVGWLRFRTRSGEYVLGLARRDLAERARSMTLTPDDADKVAEATRTQVAKVVRTILGDDVAVHVEFNDESGLARGEASSISGDR